MDDKRVNELVAEAFEKLHKGEVDTKYANSYLGLLRGQLQRQNTAVRIASTHGQTFWDGYFDKKHFTKREPK